MDAGHGVTLIRLVLFCAVLFGVSFPVRAGEHLSFFAGQPSGQGDKKSDGVQVDTFIIDNPDDIPGAVQEAAQLVQSARAQNPALGPVDLVEITGTSGTPAVSPPTGHVVSATQKAIPSLHHAAVEPDRPIETTGDDTGVDLEYFERIGAAKIRRTTTALSVVRSIVAGGVTAIALSVTQMPLPAIVAGTVAAAFVSGYMQKKNDYARHWLYGRAFWDPRDHRESSKWTWRWAYRGWRFLKEGSFVFGYLTAMHWTITAFGGPSNYLTEPLAWLAATSQTSFWSTVSAGTWSVYDAERRWQLFKENWAENRFNHAAGEHRAKRILLNSQYLAIGVSAISTLAQVLSITRDPTWEAWSSPLLWALGLGGAWVYAGRYTDISERTRELIASVPRCLMNYLRLRRRE